MKILQFPLTRITISFILGLFLYQKWQPALLWISIIAGTGVALLIAFHYLSQKKAVYNYGFGILTLTVSFNVGISTAAFHNDLLRPTHYTHFIAEKSSQGITVIVHEKLKSSARNSRYVAHLTTIDNSKSFGKIILNIRKPNSIADLSIGKQIKLNTSIYRTKNPFNPNQFDYGNYLENQQIFGQVYADEKELLTIGTNQNLWARFSNFRSKIIHNLELSHFKKEELNLIIALLLGQQQDISPEILKDYQLAGAVHILSVSGLHVGFILLFVTFLLKPVANTKRNKIIELLVILLSLWSYGLLAGLAPSVVRSVVMFSFVAIGNHLARTVNSFHTLVVSMLLILLWKPSFLFDVGFQLSYLALFFILWLQPLLSDIWKPKNKIPRYFWDILTVSFAAQIGTMPLSIYYFHQFPGLFFVTNLIVLPLLGIIMILGLIAIVIACYAKVPFIVAKPLEFLIEFQNAIIKWIASFDRFVLTHISFNTAMLWFSYLIIVAVILWFKKPNFRRLSMAVTSIILLQLAFIHTKFETQNTKELIVFHSRKNTIISERINNRVHLYSNDSILNSVEQDITVQSYLIGNFCQLKEKRKLQNLFYFNRKKILLIDSTAIYTETIRADIVIITNSPKLNMERLLSVIRPKQIVVDGSNYRSYAKLWEATCRKEKIPFHYTNEKGFYKM